MSQICISLERFESLIRSEVTVHIMDIYMSNEEYPDKDFMKALVNYGLTGLPFKPVKVETISKRKQGEEGWQE